MADYDDYDDDYDDDGYDWLYVEEPYDLADELAEYTCPSPHVEPDFAPDYDPYAYFQDLEYLSDSYYDHPARPAADHHAAKDSRQRSSKVKPSHARQRKRKREDKDHDDDERPSNVLWMSGQDLNRVMRTVNADASDASQHEQGSKLHERPRKKVALFKDWQTRFAGRRGLGVKVRDIEDDVHEGEGEGEGDGGLDVTKMLSEAFAERDDADEGEGEDEGEDEEVPEDADESAGATAPGGDLSNLLSASHLSQMQDLVKSKGLDPDAVKMVLQDLMEGRERDLGEGEEIEVPEDVDDEGEAEEMDQTELEGSQSHPQEACDESVENGAKSKGKTKAQPPSGKKRKAPDSPPSGHEASHDKAADRNGNVKGGTAQEQEVGTGSLRKKPKSAAPPPAAPPAASKETSVPRRTTRRR